MKLAVSNIAWPDGCDAQVAELLCRHGVSAVEVAPTKIWDRPADASDAEVRRYRETWTRHGIRIVAAQALLYGRDDLTVFESAAVRRQTLDYLGGILRVCAGLGAESAVFGSPKNRRVGDLDPDATQAVAAEFFGELAAVAERAGTAVVIEANPTDYGADYITRAGEAIDLVAEIDRPGMRLHLDSACMTLAGDDVETIVPAGAPYLNHFHASEPYLAAVGRGDVDHARFARALRSIGYDRWVSIEMRAPEPFSLGALEESILAAREAYLQISQT